MQPSLPSISRTFFILQNWISTQLRNSCRSSLLAPGSHHSTSGLYDFDRSKYLTQVVAYNIWFFITGLFHFVQCLQGSSTLSPMSEFLPFQDSVFHCIFMLHFAHPFTHWLVLAFLYILAMVSNAVMGRAMHIALQDPDFHSCGTTPWSVILLYINNTPMVISFLIFKRPLYGFLQWLCPYTFSAWYTYG